MKALPHPRSGFSLLEVLASLAIFGLGVFVLTEAFVNTMYSVARLKPEFTHQSDLRFVRQQVIGIADIEEFRDGGELLTLNLDLVTWEATAEPTTVLDLFDVILTFRYEDPNTRERKEVTERMYLLRPTWSDSGDRTNLLDEKRTDYEDAKREKSF